MILTTLIDCTSWISHKSLQEKTCSSLISMSRKKCLVGFNRIKFCIIFLLTALHLFDFKIPKKRKIPKNGAGVCR